MLYNYVKTVYSSPGVAAIVGGVARELMSDNAAWTTPGRAEDPPPSAVARLKSARACTDRCGLWCGRSPQIRSARGMGGCRPRAMVLRSRKAFLFEGRPLIEGTLMR